MSIFSGPAVKAVVIVPGTPYNKARAIWVGVAGDIKCTVNGVDVVHKNVPAGCFPVETTNVVAAGTSATDLVAWY
jgi:hypothetical protein